MDRPSQTKSPPAWTEFPGWLHKSVRLEDLPDFLSRTTAYRDFWLLTQTPGRPIPHHLQEHARRHAIELMGCAVRCRDDRVLGALLECDACIDALPVCGQALFARAIRDGQLFACEALLDAGFPVDSLDSSGATPLALAVVCEKTKIVSLLLRYGADSHRRQTTKDGHTPFDYALHRPAPGGVLDILAQHVDDIDSPYDRPPLAVAFISGAIEGAQVLVEKYDADVYFAMETAFNQHIDITFLRQAVFGYLADKANEHWTPPAHASFGRVARKVVETVLLCAKRSNIFLPAEMWHHVFGFMNRRHFVLHRVPAQDTPAPASV